MLTNAQVETLAIVARKYFITPSQAVALPAVVEVCQKSCGLSVDALLGRFLDTPALGEYVRHLCQKAVSASGSQMSTSLGRSDF